MRINGIYVNKHDFREAFKSPDKYKEFINKLIEGGSYGYTNNNKRN